MYINFCRPHRWWLCVIGVSKCPLGNVIFSDQRVSELFSVVINAVVVGVVVVIVGVADNVGRCCL